jgi:iron complex outermembrane recepter protein
MTLGTRLARFVSALALALPLLYPISASAQQPGPTGTITGRVVDEDGSGVANAQIYIDRPALGTQTRADGGYTLGRVPPGRYMLRSRLLGFRPESTSVTVSANAQATANFTLRHDPLQLETMVVTGTSTPRVNLDASVAVTTLTATEVQAAAPRSTTEMLRYVPGFTRVESSGGEVNQNYSMRGILGVEYVAFLEDGLPVYPAMHTYFMNADNLFRFDANIERMEVVRGGSSPLFRANAPGAIVNFINKTGGPEFGGTMRATAGTEALARYDLNMNGPVGDDWRFNIGGFYRYDHGVRDPGYPGIRGGQLKGSVTRLLNNGYLRFSVKYINDRNLFIVPLPFTNPTDPQYVPGFSDYGSMVTPEGIDITVPTPTGPLRLPLDNGLKTRGTWFTADVSLDITDDWHLQNTAGVMQNNQEWNAIPNGNLFTAQDFITAPLGSGGLGFPAGSTGQYFFTNQLDAAGNKVPFDTPNGLVARQGEWHIDKPISAVQNQLSLRRSFGRHSLSFGGYFANYTQDNHWFFTDILTDIRDIPRFLDLVVTPAGGGAPVTVTQNGFKKFVSNYQNGSGETSMISGTVGGEVQLTERLRADLGARVEYNSFVQTAENTAPFDLDANPDTPYDNITFGNNTFRHLSRSLTDWSASVGLNYRLNDKVGLYAAAARGYRMPELDKFLENKVQEQVDLFEPEEVQTLEGGVKYGADRLGFAVNGFYTRLQNITGQGATIDPITGETTWRTTSDPEARSYGAEVEVSVAPLEGLQLLGNGTVLRAEQGPGIDSLVGVRLGGVPSTIGNLAAMYSPRRVTGLQLKADFHWVGSRFVESPRDRVSGLKLPSYEYFNFGLGFAIPNAGATFNLDLLNAFQSKGLEEGNPRIVGAGSTLFFARPILPRRLQASISYDFGGSQPLDR